MADGRRIAFGTHIIPQEAADMEESTLQKWTSLRTDSSGDIITKTLGGSGLCTDLTVVQWSDSWTSMAHAQMHWEDWADATEVSGNRWEDVEEYWSGVATVGTSSGLVQLSDDGSDLSFCYIKNTGTANDLSVSVQGNSSSKYLILVPPGGSVHFRGAHTSFDCDEVFMKAVGGSTTAEYIIAKK